MGGSRRVRLLVATLVTVGVVAAACGGDDGDATDTTASPTTSAESTATSGAPSTTQEAVDPVRGGTLVVGVEAEVGNPWVPQEMNCDSSCQLRARTFFEPLMATGVDGVPRPFLAESVEMADDGLSVTVRLQEGITFHDGTPLDVDAVVENINRTIRSALTGRAAADIVKNPDGTLTYEQLDDRTLRWFFTRPWYDYPYYLGGLLASPTWLRATDADPAKKLEPVGTGPFRFVSWKAGDRLVVERNPGYWQQAPDGQPLPYLDQIEFRVVPDELSRASALDAGDLDLMQTDLAENIARYRKDSGHRLYEQGTNGETFYVLLHVGQEGSPLQDRRVRCGLAAATDTELLAATTGAGVLTPANGLFSPNQQGYLDDPGNQAHDPQEAARLIGEYTAETGAPPRILYSTVTDSTSLQTAQLLQQWWRDAGADVEIQQVEQAKLITNALLGTDDFMAFGWRNHSGFVVDQQYYWWHGSTAAPSGELALNFGRLNDPVISDLLDQNRSEPDPAKRQANAEAINRRLAEQCWVIPTNWAIWGVVTQPDVQGVGTLTFPGTDQLVRDGAGFAGQVWLHGVWLEG